jgi:hypothetical protein
MKSVRTLSWLDSLDEKRPIGDVGDNERRALWKHDSSRVLGRCVALLGILVWFLPANVAGNTSIGVNLPLGVTSLSRHMYALHMEVFWICVAIAALKCLLLGHRL